MKVARLLGVDRLNETAKKFGLGNRVLENNFFEEKKGLVPSTKWKKEAIGQNWYLGETTDNWNWPRLYTNNTFTIMSDDSSACKRRTQNTSKNYIR